MRRTDVVLAKTAHAVTAAGAIPVSAPEGSADRKTDCRHYMDCLDYAEARAWLSFSCAECPVDDRISDAERRAAGEAARTIHAIVSHPIHLPWLR